MHSRQTRQHVDVALGVGSKHKIACCRQPNAGHRRTKLFGAEQPSVDRVAVQERQAPVLDKRGLRQRHNARVGRNKQQLLDRRAYVAALHGVDRPQGYRTQRPKQRIDHDGAVCRPTDHDGIVAVDKHGSHLVVMAVVDAACVPLHSALVACVLDRPHAHGRVSRSRCQIRAVLGQPEARCHVPVSIDRVHKLDMRALELEDPERQIKVACHKHMAAIARQLNQLRGQLYICTQLRRQNTVQQKTVSRLCGSQTDRQTGGQADTSSATTHRYSVSFGSGSTTNGTLSVMRAGRHAWSDMRSDSSTRTRNWSWDAPRGRCIDEPDKDAARMEPSPWPPPDSPDEGRLDE
ncbi:hypothetical protein BC831DRAFT_6089 [Entophlyctis helioformis]|nr:hypothetical protein BC831DRAFT_6089 [Entophlyctis helioformis]